MKMVSIYSLGLKRYYEYMLTRSNLTMPEIFAVIGYRYRHEVAECIRDNIIKGRNNDQEIYTNKTIVENKTITSLKLFQSLPNDNT